MDDSRSALRALLLLLVVFSALESLRGAFTNEKTIFLLKEVLHLSASAVTNLNLLINVPQYLQPVLATAMDLNPIFGSRRRAYFVVGCLLLTAVYLVLALLPRYELMSVGLMLALAIAAVLMRSILFGAALIAVGNATGKYRYVMALSGVLGPIYAFLYGGRLGGFVTEHWSYRSAFLAAAGVAAATTALVWLVPETVEPVRRQSAEERRAERVARMAGVRAALADPRLRPIVVWVIYYGLIPGPFTAIPYFYADALHLSKTLIGELAGWQGLGVLIGTVLFLFVKVHGTVRSLALWTIGIVLSASLTWLTIRDARSALLAAIVFGAMSAASTVTYAWFVARACPAGGEAIVFSVLGSLGSLTYLICDWLGTHLYDWFGPASGRSVAFGWYVSVGANLVLTLTLLALQPLLPRTDPADGAEA